MNKALCFVRLDFITVKPYLTIKNLAIMILAPLIIMVSTGVAISSISMFIVFAALYISYPFAICEKNGIDALYSTLAIKRETVVLGRYLFAFFFDLCAGITGLVFTLIMSFIMKKTVSIDEALVVALVMLIIVSIIEAVQLPIYFKLGYEKGKIMAYIPFIGFFLGTLALKPLLDGSMPEGAVSFFGWLAANPYLAVLIGFILWLVILFLSYLTSLAFYRKRDF